MNQNRIYIGPPGSGKTYLAKKAVVEVIWERFSDSEKNDPKLKLYNPDNFCELLLIMLNQTISRG